MSPITKKQLEQRKKTIGGSDIGALFGFSQFKNRYDVWLDKTGRLVEEDLKDNKVIRRGNYMEVATLNYAEDILGKLKRNQRRVTKDLPLAVNCDAVIEEPILDFAEKGQPVEAKSVGVYSTDVWGDDGTDEIPDRIILQCHAQMICTEQKFCHVPVYLAYREFTMFGVEYNKEIAEQIIMEILDFWENNVKADTPPEGEPPTTNFIKRMKRTPDKVIEIDPEIIVQYEAAKATAASAKSLLEKSKAEILATMDDAEAATIDDEIVATYYNQTRNNVDTKALKEELPDVAADFIKETSYRVLRMKGKRK